MTKRNQDRISAAPQHVLITLEEARNVLRISLWSLRELLNRNELDSVRIGSRRLIHVDQLQRYINQLVAQGPNHDR